MDGAQIGEARQVKSVLLAVDGVGDLELQGSGARARDQGLDDGGDPGGLARAERDRIRDDPGVPTVATVRGHGEKMFVAVHGDTLRGVRVRLAGAPWDEWIVGCLPRPKKSFSPEFKDEAVNMVIEMSRPIAQVAKELGINEGTLGNWVAVYRRKHAGEGPPLPVTDRARLREVERETGN